MNNIKYYTSAFILLLLATIISVSILAYPKNSEAALKGTVCAPPDPQCGPTDCGVMVCESGTVTQLNCPSNGDVCYDTCVFKIQCTFCYNPITCKNNSPTPTSTTTVTPTPTPSMTAVDSVVIVVTATNAAPTVGTVTITEPNYCFSGPAATINWTYNDANNVPSGTDAQSAYQVQITGTGNFNNPTIDSGKILSGSNSYFIGSGLSYNTTYQVRVRVWDSTDTVSAWSASSPTWKPPQHAYAQVAFSWTPTKVHAKDVVQFSDTSTCYASGGAVDVCKSWAWTFGDGGSATQQNPAHTYNIANSYNVTLTATDGNNNSCSVSQPITVGKQIPVWKEVSPN